MLELFRDSIWQFIGAVLGIVSIPFAYWLYSLQHKYKELVFGIISQRTLLTISDEISHRLVVLLDETPVEDVNLVMLGVKNSGNMPILSDDFKRPLIITFEGNATVVSAKIVSQAPENLGAHLRIERGLVEIIPLLMNPLDTIVIQVLLSSKVPRILLDTRIVDISKTLPIADASKGVVSHINAFITVTSFIGLIGVASRFSTEILGAGYESLRSGAVLGLISIAFLYFSVELVRRKFGREARRMINID
jgi:hypothetical protein